MALTTHLRSHVAIGVVLFLAACATSTGAPLDEPLYPYPSISTCDDCQPLYAVGTDVDNDGNQDLVVGTDWGRWFTLLFGRSNGLFDRSYIQFPVQVSPVSVAVGDFDSNGT